MNKWLLILSLIFLTCLKFEFESPYEDLNGIYLQWIGSYGVEARKIVVVSKTGYFSRPYYLPIYIESYVMSTDSVYKLASYTSDKAIADFDIFENFAFLATPSFGLEVINFQCPEPFLYSDFEITGGADFIRLHHNYAYLAGDSNFYVIDISDKQNPKKIAEFKFEDGARWLEVDSNHAYVLLKNRDFCILNIENPANPNIILQSHYDTLPEITMFVINNNYIHFLTVMHEIRTYYFKEGTDLLYQSWLGFPENISFIYGEDKYGLALSYKTIYLLNLEYPARPCVTEMINLPESPDYGIIKGNYIYVLTPYLNIIEIKEIPK